ncbi:glycosyltransferase family 25 protein, partial [Mycobacterium tuberculosis]
ISLKRRTDRLEHMQALLARRGLKAEFVEAVDGTALTADQRARYDRDKALSVYGAEMNAAEIGCCLSHLKVYQTIVDEGIDTALVLEDDIDCDADFADLLDAILANSRREWLVLRLQSTKGEIINANRPSTRGDRSETFRGRTLCRVRTGVLGGCGYLIRYDGAARMLRYAERPFMPIDQTMDRYWENGIEPYVLRPFPVRQSPRIASEISTRKVRPAMSGYRTALRRGRRFADGVRKRAFQLVQLDGWREAARIVNLVGPLQVSRWRPTGSAASQPHG